MLQGKRLGFIGAGNMAEAIMRGVLDSGKVKAAEITAGDSNFERLNVIVEGFGIEGHNKNFEVAKKADIIILAVKPQVMDKVLADIKNEISGDKLVISIAAGVKLKTLAAGLKKGAKIVRVMPNTPALVLAGISAICPGEGIDDADKKALFAIFDAIGESVLLDNEGLMDAVTGLSGSGPAFVYTFIEALSDAGVKVGLPRDISTRLAMQTVYGSAKVVKELERHPAELRDMVTSPGGTTIAGMGALEEKGFRAAVISAVEAATKRSKELGE
ncbi:MAG: pyrroline-5-carboxylate reductase [Deltaproteobacteria bacterium]|nr:pyrroline-5-carboxylate reductase [Deltaproteobacteria bacterium]